MGIIISAQPFADLLIRPHTFQKGKKYLFECCFDVMRKKRFL